MAVEIGWGYPSINKKVEPYAYVKLSNDEEIKEEPTEEKEEAKHQQKKKK